MIQITKYSNGFPCTQCGVCCKKVGKWIIDINKIFEKLNISKEEFEFTPKINSKGECEHLTEKGKCAIYNDRPNLCRSEWVANKLKIHPNLLYPKIIKVCNQLMDEENIGEEYRIKE